MNAPEPQSSSRFMRLVLAGIVLVTLLGVVALVSRGHVSPAGSGAHDRGASSTLSNAILTIWVIAMIGGACVLAFMLSLKKRDSKASEFRVKPLLASLLFFAVVVIGIVIAYNHLGNPNHRQPQSRLGFAHKHPIKAKPGKNLRLATRRPEPFKFNWALAGGLCALIAGASVTALITAQRRRNKLLKEVTAAHELMLMLDETLDDIRAEADPRRAVIAAYARMEHILAAHDLGRRPSEAPVEYLTRVLVELRVTEEAIRKLTTLYERAKFSEHEIDTGMKEDAIDALVSLRVDLRAIDLHEDKPDLLLSEVTKPAL